MDVNITHWPHEAGFPSKLITDLAPHLFWGLVILIVILVIGPNRIRGAFSNARKIGFGGLEIELKGEIDAAAQARKINLPPSLRDQLARRLERLQSFVTGARLLWIDDEPANNVIEIGLLNRLGITIDLARSDEAARQMLRNGVYDLVLSDMTRGQDEEAGKKFMPDIISAILAPPLIFYVGKARDVPNGAFGLTVRPDELLNLIVDALERRRS